VGLLRLKVVVAMVTSTRPVAEISRIGPGSVALTECQIHAYKLLTRSTKKSSRFKVRSVEIDTLSMGMFWGLVDRAISQHIPTGYLEMMVRVEAQERAFLDCFIESIDRGRSE